MIWTGKLIFGALAFLIFHHPLAVLAGIYIGHQFDRKKQRIGGFNRFRQMGADEREDLNRALLEAVFSILGHLAKADGRVSKEEIAQAESLMTRMGLVGDKRQQAIDFFNQGKQPDFPLEQVVARFRERTKHRRLITINFLETLVSAALSDGTLHPEEERVLLSVAAGLGIPQARFQQILSMLKAQASFSQGAHQYGSQYRTHGGGYYRQAGQSQGQTLSNAYGVLGVSSDQGDADIKKAYRRLMSRHHPDKLAAQGLGEEQIRMATDKAAKISRAYELIKGHRQFK